jgi:hypothetical protein
MSLGYQDGVFGPASTRSVATYEIRQYLVHVDSSLAL